ncbi:MAG: cheB2 [Candidatus Solibacter sp.]|jgi:two-component system chemotaxis response regulator CheB|nr:cheB2 [Candidatus Solibacter sp.]
MSKIRVMVVEDSAVVRALLQHIIGGDARLEVMAAAASAEEALSMLKRMSPDVIVMDIRLPGMDGLEATRRIMSQKPIPIVVVAGVVESKERSSTTMEALRAGALSVLEKPVGTTHADYETLAERFCTQLAIMSQVKLVRQTTRRNSRLLPAHDEPRRGGAYSMLGIVCSTGGPGALVKLLGALGPDFPLPILLVQHMTASFLPGFASWLESVCPFSVAMVSDGQVPAVGVVHMAPAEQHLRLDAGSLRLDLAAPVCGQRPSGTVLFQSMASSLGGHALGILLTGMGEDGAAGLGEIRQAGGYTIAEDESTAVVYGMPAVAVRMGAVCESLPLPAIAPRVLELVSARPEMN